MYLTSTYEGGDYHQFSCDFDSYLLWGTLDTTQVVCFLKFCWKWLKLWMPITHKVQTINMIQHKNYLWDCILYHIYYYTIYKYLCNQCLSPLALWIWIPLRWGVLDTTLSDKVSQWLSAGRWFSTGTPISSTNKTDCLDIIEILLKVVLNTITLTSLCQYLYHIYSLLHKTHLYASICTIIYSLQHKTHFHASKCMVLYIFSLT